MGSDKTPSRWDLLRALERVAPRCTLGDVMLQLPDFDGTSDDLRRAVVDAGHAAGAHVEQSPAGEVVYVFPPRVRAAVLARSSRESSRALRRKTWRGFLVFLRGAFAVFLVASVVLVFLALVAILIITLTQDRGGRGGGGDALPIFFGPGGPGGGGGGGGPYYHRHVGMDGDFWLYLYMRDIMWFTYWNEHEHRRHMYMTGQYGGDVAVGVPAAGKGRPRAPGGGGPGGEGGPGGDGPGSGPGSGPPPRGDPSDWARFVADQDDEDAKNEDKNRELSFIESVFAFVFGRGDPNDALEMRRWRAVSALLRVNRGVVFAEQVAPFLDTHLLGPDGGGAASSTWTLGGFADAVARAISFGTSRRDDRDGSRDASRMHEGYMLEVLSKFGGHAEASDDGKLVYVFPALQVTAMHEEGSSAAAEAAAREARAPPPLPPPIAPPMYERERPTWEGGEKMPLVIGLGVLNLALVVLFWGVGGMDFRAPRRALGVRARQTMGRRAGGGLAAAAAREDAAKAARATREAVQAARAAGENVDAAARAAGGEIIYERPPALIGFLELFPWACRKTYPALLCYALAFFLVPCARAAFCHWENKNIRARNARRRAAATNALQALVAAARDKQDRAHGKRALVRVDE